MAPLQIALTTHHQPTSAHLRSHHKRDPPPEQLNPSPLYPETTILPESATPRHIHTRPRPRPIKTLERRTRNKAAPRGGGGGTRGLTGSDSTLIAGETARLPARICCRRSGKLALCAAMAAAISDRDPSPARHLRRKKPPRANNQRKWRIKNPTRNPTKTLARPGPDRRPPGAGASLATGRVPDGFGVRVHGCRWWGTERMECMRVRCQEVSFRGRCQNSLKARTRAVGRHAVRVGRW